MSLIMYTETVHWIKFYYLGNQRIILVVLRKILSGMHKS